ncbi:MAG: hypothetical protein H6727_03585 [Myxococcales bacterium]|nr:hypothetical protein [Myxococcales bacterium]
MTAQDRIGSQIGLFTLQSLIRTTYYGSLYAAQDPQQESVWLLLCDQGYAHLIKENAEETENYIQIYKQIESEDLLRLRNYDIQGEEPYFVFDAFAGLQTLNDAKSRLARPAALQLFSTLAKDLADFEKAGARVKSMDGDHIFVDTGSLRVRWLRVDLLFGFSLSKLSQTSAGVVRGNVRYIAPEQARATPATQATPYFMLGTHLFETLSGQPAFTGQSDIARLQQLLSSPTEQVESSSLAEEDRALLRKLMDPDESTRLQSTEAFETALQTLPNRTAAPPLAPGGPGFATPPSRPVFPQSAPAPQSPSPIGGAPQLGAAPPAPRSAPPMSAPPSQPINFSPPPPPAPMAPPAPSPMGPPPPIASTAPSTEPDLVPIQAETSAPSGSSSVLDDILSTQDDFGGLDGLFAEKKSDIDDLLNMNQIPASEPFGADDDMAEEDEAEESFFDTSEEPALPRESAKSAFAPPAEEPISFSESADAASGSTIQTPSFVEDSRSAFPEPIVNEAPAPQLGASEISVSFDEVPTLEPQEESASSPQKEAKVEAPRPKAKPAKKSAVSRERQAGRRLEQETTEAEINLVEENAAKIEIVQESLSIEITDEEDTGSASIEISRSFVEFQAENQEVPKPNYEHAVQLSISPPSPMDDDSQPPPPSMGSYAPASPLAPPSPRVEEWKDDMTALRQEKPKTPKMKDVKVLRRKGVVRYYEQMNPQKIFPLLVSIIQAEMYIKIPDLPRVKQAESEKVLEIKENSPYVRLVPVIPGCIISPPEAVVDVRKEKVDTEFWVSPQAEGDLRRSARVQVWHEGVLKDEIPIPTRVRTQTLTKVISSMSFMSGLAGAVFEAYGKKLTATGAKVGTKALAAGSKVGTKALAVGSKVGTKALAVGTKAGTKALAVGAKVGAKTGVGLTAAAPADDKTSLAAFLIKKIVGFLGSSGIVVAFVFLVAALLCYWWLKPKRGDEIEHFLNSELH